MTATWTGLTATYAANDQVPADTFNEIIDDLNFLRDPPADLYSLSIGGSNLTTTSTTMVALTGFSITLTTQGNPVTMRFMARTNGNTRFDFYVDGVSVTGDNDGLGNGGTTFATHCERVVSVSAGSHTFAVYWRVTSSTGTVYAAGLAQFEVTERGSI